jgi:siroheme synthase-like protein
MKVYPIFLNNLDEQRSIVIGGDHEAERKVGGLLEVDALVTLISPDPSERLKRWAHEGAIDWIDREYERGDLEGAFLVIVSEYNPERSQRIWEEAQERNVLINAMDDVPRCNFVAGSVVRRGPLVISISTTGKAPTLSVRMREELEEEIGPEYEEFLEIMHKLREPMAATYPDFDHRRDLWYEIVDSEVLDLIRDDHHEAAFQCIRDIVGDEVVDTIAVTP